MAKQEIILAENLERLFEVARKPDGSKYTQAEVVAGTNGILTRVYLWKLRTGRAVNPGFRIIQALADFFGVDTTYFSDSGDEEMPRPEGKTIEDIMHRAYQLDEQGRKAILNLMDYILSVQDGGARAPDPETGQSGDENHR